MNLLIVPGQIGANPVLPGGEHSFPFEVRLPEDNLPTTFEGKHGHVKYWLKAILDRPWKDEIKIVEPFTVTERIDVNQPEFLVRSCTDHSVQCKLHEYGYTINGNTDGKEFELGAPFVQMEMERERERVTPRRGK